jgi:uncharacterized protein (DUF427 family)
MSTDHRIAIEPSRKRVRVMAGGQTVADSSDTVLLLEAGCSPVYYFPREHVRMDLLQSTDRRTNCPSKGEAAYWSLKCGARTIEDAVWGYEQPVAGAEPIAGRLAFYWDKVEHWFEEDEEIFGHPRDPHHRVDVLPSSREVQVMFGGETVARTRRAMFLFETGLPTRYYIPPTDVRRDLLVPSQTVTTCPYKGRASYWSIRVGDRLAEDAVWAYREPLEDCPRIIGHFCFYPEKVDRITVEDRPG